MGPELEWKQGGVPVSRQFEDPFYSLEDGLGETRHVFLAGNGLPDRFTGGFHIAELGFGTGLNLLATALCWSESGRTDQFRYTSFEAYPLDAEEIETALRAFPEAHAIADPLLQAWSQGHSSFETPEARVEIVIGDARETLPRWNGQVDAWYLDGFAPQRNPELWEPCLLTDVALHTAPGGTCATYTAAGNVRRALEQAGFEIQRVPGFGRKRHMSVGVLR